jgi:predicted alpha/beta superfamily hydrolase
MNRSLLLFFVLSACAFRSMAQQALPQVRSGSMVRIESFKSKYISPRHIDIWLPEGYSDSEKYAVLYMQDGQMLYDSSITWNKQSWNVDDVASGLMSNNKVRGCIVVGIWNGGSTRHQDYFPQKAYNTLTKVEKDSVSAQLQRAKKTTGYFQPQSDRYLKFIVEELKPYIDTAFSVKTNQENTFIAGSSMGGLISLYALCEYPSVFGGAACLSTHWTGVYTLQDNPIPAALLQYLKRKLPNPKNHSLYFDCGDQTLDSLYPSVQRKVDALMQRRGYDTHHWMTQYIQGADHSEKSWNKRLHVPLEFLLGE